MSWKWSVLVGSDASPSNETVALIVAMSVVSSQCRHELYTLHHTQAHVRSR